MKNKKFGKIGALLLAAAMLVTTVVPVYAAENIIDMVKSQVMTMEAGTDRVTYRVDTEKNPQEPERRQIIQAKDPESRRKPRVREHQLRTQPKPEKIQRREKKPKQIPGLR